MRWRSRINDAKSHGAAIVVVLMSMPMIVSCNSADSVAQQAAAAARRAAEAATGDAAVVAVSAAATAALAAEGIQLVAPPDCTRDLTINAEQATARGTVNCLARTRDSRAVQVTFDGSLSGSGCEGRVLINVQGRDPLTISALPKCNLGGVVGNSGASDS